MKRMPCMLEGLHDNAASAKGHFSAAPIVLQVREQLDPQIKAAKPRWIGDITLTE